ncbi:MAG TPA: hypothetical protein VF841_09510 [Anaeromyxobacter sp.]
MASRAWWVAAAAAATGAALAPRAARAGDPGQGGGASLADDRTLVALAVALACAPDASQAGPRPPAGLEASAPADGGPQLELVATVRARALRFDVVPRAELLPRGPGRGKTAWKAERVNLPMHPEPGVTYRDVAVRLVVTSDPQGLAALLREASRAAAGIRMEQAGPLAAPGPARRTSVEPVPGATAGVPGATATAPAR